MRIEPARSPRAFLDAQRAFYRGDPAYVPPLTLIDQAQLSPTKNAFFARAKVGLWLAFDGRRCVGRVSTVRNFVHDEFWGDRVGFFGHFEANGPDATRALIEHARTWLAQEGAGVMRGPIDLSTNYKTGLFVDGDPGMPAMMMPYNPVAYGTWLTDAGLHKAKDVLALDVDTTTLDHDRLRRLGDKVAARARVTLRPLRMANFAGEIARIWQLYNSIWEHNWGFVPMGRAEFEREANAFKAICRPELIRFAECGGEPVGFIIGLPDISPAIAACRGRLLPFGFLAMLRALRRVRRLRVLTLGVRPEHRGRGIDAALIHGVVASGIARGFQSAECGWVLEDNEAMLRPLFGIGARVFRRYRVYEDDLRREPTTAGAGDAASDHARSS
ncbi:MAG: GNAT family N-acetyltransferase [Planctomycetota bacterium]